MPSKKPKKSNCPLRKKIKGKYGCEGTFGFLSCSACGLNHPDAQEVFSHIAQSIAAEEDKNFLDTVKKALTSRPSTRRDPS